MPLRLGGNYGRFVGDHIPCADCMESCKVAVVYHKPEGPESLSGHSCMTSLQNLLPCSYRMALCGTSSDMYDCRT